jgi:hypothetical protein
VLSTIIESNLIPLLSYSLATSVQVFKKRPSPSCESRTHDQISTCPYRAQPRTDLHNVSLVYTSDLFPSVLESVVERKPGNPLGLDPGHDLQVLYYSWVTLVLQSSVLSLGVFTDDGEVDIVVSGGHTGQRLADDHVGVNVERLTHGNVPRVVSVDGGVENSLETDLVSLEGLHGSLELGLVSVGLTADIVLLPLNGDIQRGKDLLDRVGNLVSDTVSGNQSDGVGSTVLGGDLKCAIGA